MEIPHSLLTFANKSGTLSVYNGTRKATGNVAEGLGNSHLNLISPPSSPKAGLSPSSKILKQTQKQRRLWFCPKTPRK